MMKYAVTFMILLMLFVFPACSSEGNNEGSQNGFPNSEQQEDKAISEGNSEQNVEQLVTEKALQTIELLKSKDFEKLSEWVHPEKGVRFSPYAFVYIDQDVVLSAEQLSTAFNDDELKVWGYYDGSGEPIEATFAGYYEQFIYDADFIQSDEISFDRRIGQGNTANNAFEAYPDAHIVEFHIRGVDEELEGMDWRSLRLAFEEWEGSWVLVGIIHDQWTI